MKEIFKMTRIFVLSTFGLSTIKYQLGKSRKQIWKPIMALLLLASIIPSYVLYIGFIKNLYIQLYTLGQESSIFTLVIIPLSLMILFFGLIYAMSAFYFSKDIEPLIPLPVKESKIVLAKFISMLVYEYCIIIPFLLPVIIIAAQEFMSIHYLINSILAVLLLPVIPLGLATIIVMVLMRITNIQGKKDMIRNISMFVTLFLIIALQVLITNYFARIPAGSQGQFFSDLLMKGDGLIHFMGRAYPPSIWFSLSISSTSMITAFFYLVICVIASLIMLVVIEQLGKRIYIKTLLEKNNFKSHRKELAVESLVIERPKYLTIFINDLRLVLRTPVYMFNCVSTAFLIPILVVVMPLLTNTSSQQDIDFSQLYASYSDIFTLILVAFFAFIASVNPTASTTFSREGKANWISGIIPTYPSDVFVGRILQPILLQIIAMLLMVTAMLFILPLGILDMIIAVVIGLIVSLPIIAVGIVIDGINPKLEWEDPQKAVKQNLNVVYNMFIGVGYTFLLGYVTFKMVKANLNLLFVYAFIIILSLVFTGILYKFFCKVLKY